MWGGGERKVSDKHEKHFDRSSERRISEKQILNLLEISSNNNKTM